MVWRTADGTANGTADGTVSEAAGPRVRSPPCAPSDASHAAGSDLSGAQHEQETPTAQDLAVSAEECCDQSSKPSLVCRYYVYSDAARVPISRGDHGWFSRKVLAWRLSNSMDAAFCVEALKEPLAKYGAPEIFNTDQGSQFTSGDWIDVLNDVKIKISMDGKGAGLITA